MVNINSLLYNEASQTRTISITNTLRLGTLGGIYRTTGDATSNALTISGGVLTAGGNTTGTAGEIVVDVNRTASGTGTDMTISSQITNNGSGVVSLTKTGRGYISVSNANNNYTGGTYIDEGRLTAVTGSLGTGSIVVTDGGELFGGSFSQNAFIAGTGPQNESGNGAV